MTKNFSRRLNQMMKEKNVSQTELAAMLGISKSSVNGWCKGTTTPKKETLNRIYEVLGVCETITLGKQDGEPIESIIGGIADNVSDFEACRNKVLCKMLWTPATKDEMIVAEYAINAFIREITGGSNETDHNRRDEDESDGI